MNATCNRFRECPGEVLTGIKAVEGLEAHSEPTHGTAQILFGSAGKAVRMKFARRSLLMLGRFAFAFLLHVAGPYSLNLNAAGLTLDDTKWIWSASETDPECALRRSFTLDHKPRKATLLITADNGYEVCINGAKVGGESGAAAEVWQSVERFDVTSRLLAGRNIIGIRGIDLGGTRGVIAALEIEESASKKLRITTDETWHAATEGQPIDYSHPEFVETAAWRPARVIGPMGVQPWGVLSIDRKPTPAKGQPPIELTQPSADFHWPEAVAFVAADVSTYVPLRGDAWGVAFRVRDWSRAYTEFDLPCPAKIGRKLLVLKPGPNAKPKLLVDAGGGALGSPCATFDGRAVLVSMAKGKDPFFHIYRVQVENGAVQQLTHGPFHDIDPAELPDGRIVFTSTRIGTFEEYHQPPSRALFRMNADGTQAQPVTSTLIFDNEPKVLANGRIVFIRTDNFFDRGKVETHLHSIRPDGTDGLAEFGANVGADYGSRLRAFGYGSPAPMPDGRLAYISNRGNFIGASGSPESAQHRLPDPLGDVASLPDGRLLATVLRPAGSRVASDVLAVIDPADNRLVPIYESHGSSLHSPVFLGARQRPPIIPDYATTSRTEHQAATGYLLCSDARFTTKTKAGWDQIKAIRVLGAKPLTIRASHSHIVHVGHETVELGVVPLAPDGSFHIEVPADMPLALQAVDAEGRSELNEMSWLYVRPGERRSCIGCHQPREAAPAAIGRPAEALNAPAVKLLGQGDPHRFRGNNPGVTGMMDLQFERFRECASLNRNSLRDGLGDTHADELRFWKTALSSTDDARRISAAQRLGLFRDHEVAASLSLLLNDVNASREAHLAAAIALASCGTRESTAALLDSMQTEDLIVRQAASLALENLTGASPPPSTHQDWQTWLAAHSWEAIETDLCRELSTTFPPRRTAVVALGHIGSKAGVQALQAFVRKSAAEHPYPVFVNDNRTDTFTYSADSPWNPRLLQEAVRALGHLKDPSSIPLMDEILKAHLDPVRGNLYLAEAAIECLGRLGGKDAEAVLIGVLGRLLDYWDYVGWYSDHPALYACHSSPIHARVLEALDRMGSTQTASFAGALIRSVPTDPDRALFPGNDDYEALVGRLLRRSGRGAEVVEACLASLGDMQARSGQDIASALAHTHPAWAGHPGAANRSAQILSLVCADARYEPRIRAAFERYQAMPEEPVQRSLGNPNWTPVRHWTLFYLARTLGNLKSKASAPRLAAVLADNLNEARHGRPDPTQPEIHFLQLEYTPCWRAAAAWALGEIGDRKVRPSLVRTVKNMNNAVDVRKTAADALGKLFEAGDASELTAMASATQEESVKRALQSAASGSTAQSRPGVRAGSTAPQQHASRP